jgi:hypothetical protein
MYFVSTYENRKMKPVEIALRRVGERRGRMKEKVNVTKIYYKHICKFQMYPPAHFSYANTFLIQKRESSLWSYSLYPIMLCD